MLTYRTADTGGPFCEDLGLTSPSIVWPILTISSDIAEDASSPRCIELAANWLRECIDKHPDCRSGSSTPPTRLIYVGDSMNEPRLYIPSPNETLSYAALSYAWGGRHDAVTTKANMDERLMGIPLMTMPKTIQDAIIFARALDLQYLWVDSICILQDGLDDWATEAAKMSSVYENAKLTLSADAAEDPTIGLFFKRPPGTQSRIFKVTNDGINIAVHTRRRLGHAGGVDDTRFGHDIESFKSHKLYKNPLEERGWVHQERLLSYRVLHFTKTELTWECASRISCECKTRRNEHHTEGRTVSELKCKLNNPSKALAPPPAYQKNKLSDVEATWLKLVAKQTAKKLTFESDRLLTMSSFAKKLNKDGAKDYLCGLWVQNLPMWLLWQTTTKAGGYAEFDPTQRRQQPQAPSWSWASITGPVCYISQIDLSMPQYGISILEAVTTLSTPNMYGPVSYGYIRVKGHIAMVKITEAEKLPLVPYIVSRLDSSGHISGRGVWLPDVFTGDAEWALGDILPVLLVAHAKWDRGDMLVGGLLLRPSRTTSGCYQRIGFVQSYPRSRVEWNARDLWPAWLADSKEQTITIV
jgi:hypothetical protein